MDEEKKIRKFDNQEYHNAYHRRNYQRMNRVRTKFNQARQIIYEYRYVVNTEGEETLPVCTILELAKVLQITHITAYRWIRDQFLPAPIYKVLKGRKYAKAYHFDEVKAIIDVLQEVCPDRAFVPLRSLALAEMLTKAFNVVRQKLPKVIEEK
jgi:hypothetical protein